ncbi:MAG: glycosyltransferase family 39 protein [Anaerolineales bacterium]|nr:glycosyltransferase family 39 protein [Anaerolineales bacterium]
MPDPEQDALSPQTLLPEEPNDQTATTDTPPTPPPRRWSWEQIALVPLLLILILAAYFRFTGLNWDGDNHLHPDERFLTIVGTQLHSTDPLTYLRTSESPLNPYNAGQTFYVYGNFPMTATRLVAEWAVKFCDLFDTLCHYSFTAYDGIHLVGRALSGLVDLLSVAFIFLIGRRLYDWRVGLLGALFLAVAVMPIQQSHFFTMDNWAAALTTMTMYTAVRAAAAGEKKRWWLLFGLGLGLVVASRINVAPVAMLAGVAAIVWLARRGQAAGYQGLRYLSSEAGYTDVQRAIIGVALAALMSLLVFRLAQPYAFQDPAMVRSIALQETGTEPGLLTIVAKTLVGFNPAWRSNMEEIQRLQSPDASFPPALQWTDRAPIVFPLSNMVLYGMGLSAGILAWIGFLWALWRIIRGKPDWLAHALPVAWIGLYFLFMATRWVKSIRYFLPLYPFLLLLAGWALVELWRKAGAAPNRRPLYRLGVALLAMIAFVPSLLWAYAFVQIYHQPVTRVAASEWMYQNLRSGASLVYEVDGQPGEIQLPLKGYDLMPESLPLNLSFTLPDSLVSNAATVTGVRFNYLSAAEGGSDSAALAVRLVSGDNQSQPLAEAEATFTLGQERQAITVPLAPAILQANTPYLVIVEGRPGGAIRMGTSVIANETWDDALPVRLHGRDPYSQYFVGITGGQVPITNLDSPEKRDQMLAWLNESDVILLTSQRAIWSTARLPLSYPLTMRYYEGLFNGDLGFELVQQYQADFTIGPLHVSDITGQVGWGKQPPAGWPPPGDLAAEEAFSVYDHPPVWVFVKQDDYDPAQTAAVLNNVDLSQVIFMTPGQATRAPNGLMLTPQDEATQQANGTFRAIFHLDGLLERSPAAAAVIWWLAVVGLGLLTFPMTFVLFRGFADRGYALSRILSLLLVSYFGWILASLKLAGNTRGTLLVGVALLVGLNLFIFLRRRQEILEFLRAHLGYVVLMEAVSLGLYLLFIGIRLGNPDVWDVIWGGEKPMDLSYFTAVMKSTTFPPYDPWLSGGYINYYYYGFVYVGALTKLLGIMPAIAYNLILPTLFSFTGMGAFTIAANLVAYRERARETVGSLWQRVQTRLRSRAVMAGLVALLLCVFLGNLAEVKVLADAWYRTSDSTVETGIGTVDYLVRVLDGGADILIGGKAPAIYPGDWFWTATRAININEGETAPITEFPFFTFLYGDLHAHMISMPLMLLALGWAVALALEEADDRRRGWQRVGQWLVGGLAIGVLRATNTWDWPTYLVIGSLAVLFAGIRRRGGLSLVALGEAALQTAALVGIAVITFLPYAQNYGVGYASVTLWQGSHTHLSNYLFIYGLFLFILVTHLAREFRAWTQTWTEEGLRRWEPLSRVVIGAVVLYLLLILVLLLRGYWVAPLVLSLVAVAGLLGLRPDLSPERRVVLILISAAFFLTLAVEFVVLQGDIGRMNTVFKFYLQVWLILSVVSGAAVAWAWPALRAAWGQTRRLAWQTSLGILVAMALLYPVLATKAKWQIRMNPDAPHTLDGMAFMTVTEYGDMGQTIPLRYDYEAIQWMMRHVDGSPVIAEAHSDNPYRAAANRVAMYTGLPAIVGWDWHQRQQRTVLPGTVVSKRIADVNLLYNTTDANEAMRILDQYGVQYVYAGPLEWAYYNSAGIDKFAQMARDGLLEEVYRNSGVSIYRVRG